VGFGDRFSGLVKKKGYFSIWLWPIGVEIVIQRTFLVFSISIDRLEIAVNIRRSINMF